MDKFLDEPRHLGQPIYLGILGKHEKISKNDIYEGILQPLISAIGRLPDKVYVPSDGLSSIYIGMWSGKQRIDTETLDAEWYRLGKRAGYMRDTRIIKESTHLLIFGGQRSSMNETIGIREAKRGKHVFLVDHATLDISELVVEA
jgi:hypothetical protein